MYLDDQELSEIMVDALPQSSYDSLVAEIAKALVGEISSDTTLGDILAYIPADHRAKAASYISRRESEAEEEAEEAMCEEAYREFCAEAYPRYQYDCPY